MSFDLKRDMCTYLVFVFGKVKVLEWPLSRKWYFSLYNYIFDKYKGWACPSMSVEAKRDIWTNFVLNSVNIKYWDDPCRKKVILAYMVANLINGQVEIVPCRDNGHYNSFILLNPKPNRFSSCFKSRDTFNLPIYKI